MNLDQARAVAQRLRDAGFTGETLGYADILDALIAEVERLREVLDRMRRWAEGDKVNYTGDHPVALARAALQGGAK